jgi:hypothetical protein
VNVEPSAGFVGQNEVLFPAIVEALLTKASGGE